MPWYDLKRPTVTNGSGGTVSTHLVGKTVANQETVSIMALYCAARFGNAGGNIMRIMDNSGAASTGGTAQTPRAKNLRLGVAAQSTWVDDTSAITAGGTLNQRAIAGFAATGGQGGLVPIVPQDAIKLMANGANPVDVELQSIASQASVNFDWQLDVKEGED